MSDDVIDVRMRDLDGSDRWYPATVLRRAPYVDPVLVDDPGKSQGVLVRMPDGAERIIPWCDFAGRPNVRPHDSNTADLLAIRDAALALSRAVEPADLPPAARPLLLVLRAHLAASGVDPVGEVEEPVTGLSVDAAQRHIDGRIGKGRGSVVASDDGRTVVVTLPLDTSDETEAKIAAWMSRRWQVGVSVQVRRGR